MTNGDAVLLRIALVSRPNASTVASYSGIPFHIAGAIRQAGHTVDLVSPLCYKPSLLLKLKSHWYSNFRGYKFLRDRDACALRQYAATVQTGLARLAPDAVVSIDTLPFLYADLPANTPLIIWAEATFNGCRDFFPGLTGLAQKSIRNAELVERTALHKAAYVVFPSNWAAREAIEHYGLPAGRVRVIPYGANVTSALSLKDAENLITSRTLGPLRFLHVGADWSRKGLNKAVAVVRELKNRGWDVEFDIVGSRWVDPSVVPLDAYIINHGYVDKTTEDGRAKLDQLYRRSKYFLMLSNAETFGIVYAEAAAYALPSIAHDVGGVEDAVANGRSALLFVPATDVSAICDRIEIVEANPSAYRSMALGALGLFQEKLNWQVISEQLDALLTEACQPRTNLSKGAS